MHYRIVHCLPEQPGALNQRELTTLFALVERDGLRETAFYDGGVHSAAHFVEMMADERTWFYLVCRAVPEKKITGGGSTRGGCSTVPRYAQGQEARRKQETPRIRGELPLAFCWLNNFSGSGAMIHFCVYRHAMAEAEDIGRFVTRMLLLAKPGAATPHAVCAGSPEAARAYRDAAEKDRGAPFCLDALYGMTPAVFRHAVAFVRSFGFQKKGELPFAVRLLRNGKERFMPGVLTCLTRSGLC